jgi:replicative DNA helicase
MDVLGLVDKKNIFMLLGVYCHNPKFLIDKRYETNSHDYNEVFHKTIWGAMINIAKKSTINKITPIEIENELSPFPLALKTWVDNKGAEYIYSAMEATEDKIMNIGVYFDNVRKFSILRMAQETLKLDISFIYDENDFNKLSIFNEMNSHQVLATVYTKFDEFKNLWKNNFGDGYSFHIGDGIDDTLNKCKNQDNTYGYPFQSQYLTTALRGMKKQKFVLISSKSGGGKSRKAMADGINIACDRIYDWKNKVWLSTGEKQPVLFISTELTRTEIQMCILAHIAGIEEDRITEWKEITKEEEIILEESKRIMKDSNLLIEYLPDFTIDTIEETIERYIINHNITHCFFDYINDSASMYSYYTQKTGIRLQTHQILFLFSMALKQLANKYDIYLGSATQLSSNYKEEKDANAIKGSKAIIDKADAGIISLPASAADLKKLKPILENGFYEVPNFAYYIFKNRGNKWNNIIIWTKLNMGSMREKDCFVTNENFELITDIEKTMIDFAMEDVGDCGTIETDDSANEFIADFKNAKIE